MRKTIVLAALALLASAVCNVAEAALQKKKAAAAEKNMPVEALSTPSDSLSYAAGMSMTEGLLPFLKSNFGVEEKNLGSVEEGFKATMAKGADPQQKAYIAGAQVAYMVLERMLPKLKEDFAGSKEEINMEVFTRGFVNALKKDYTAMADTTAHKYFNAERKRIKDERDSVNRKAGEDFLAANAKKAGVKTTASGLQYEVLTEGKGEIPGDGDEVVVKYEGRLLDGTVFDSSYKRGDGTAKFRPSQLIKGWGEALKMMPAGSKWKLYIPYNLAYGERDMREIKPYSTLVFTVELVKVEKKQAATTPVKAASATQKPVSKPVNSQAKKSK